MKSAKERYKTRGRLIRLISKASDEDVQKAVSYLWPKLTAEQRKKFTEAGYEPPG